MADRIFPYGVEDAWCVDAGLETKFSFAASGNLTGNLAAASGNGVLFTGLPAGSWGFQPFHIGYTMRVSGAICTIASLVGPPGTNQVLVNITTPATFVNPYTNIPYSDSAASGWAPITTVTGLDHLIGQQVVGLADGTPVGPLTVTYVGGVASVTLPNAASKVTLGLAFTPQLQTLQLDLGEPTVQGKRKKISACTVRVKDALGLQFGTSFTTLVTMKDFIIGNVGSASNKIVTGLVTADARTIADPLWQVPGQYCLQQPLPYPATILGVIPEIEVGDTPK
jgi:hypothetical protein